MAVLTSESFFTSPLFLYIFLFTASNSLSQSLSLSLSLSLSPLSLPSFLCVSVSHSFLSLSLCMALVPFSLIFLGVSFIRKQLKYKQDNNKKSTAATKNQLYLNKKKKKKKFNAILSYLTTSQRFIKKVFRRNTQKNIVQVGPVLAKQCGKESHSVFQLMVVKRFVGLSLPQITEILNISHHGRLYL